MSSKYEQETVINFNEAEVVAKIYSASKRVWHKCEKAGYKLVKTEMMNGEPSGKFYECEKVMISFRSKIRKMSQEQREALKQRAKLMLFGKKRLGELDSTGKQD
jgi:hypothetical protein